MNNYDIDKFFSGEAGEEFGNEIRYIESSCTRKFWQHIGSTCLYFKIDFEFIHDRYTQSLDGLTPGGCDTEVKFTVLEAYFTNAEKDIIPVTDQQLKAIEKQVKYYL